MKTSCATTQFSSLRPINRTIHPGIVWRCLFVVSLFLGAFAVCPAFAQQVPATQGTDKPVAGEQVVAPGNSFITSATRILPGSLLHVEVKDEEELTGDYAVDAGGKITFTLSDTQGVLKETWPVAVANQTTADARDTITESLKKYLRVPEVQVTLLSVPHTRIELWGSGCRPGPLDLELNAHLSDILASCRTNADFSRILIVRRVEAAQVPAGNEGTKATTVSSSVAQSTDSVSLTDQTGNRIAPQIASQTPAAGSKSDGTEKGSGVAGGSRADGARSTRTLVIDFTPYQLGESTVDPPLQDGDKIYIQLKPETKPAYTLRTVRVVGEVGREADIPYTPGMTVKDAITSAGGVKETADKNRIRVHQIESGHDYDLKVAGVMGNDPDVNMKLEPGDYIYVMKSDLRLRWGIDGEVVRRDIFPYTPGQKITVSSAIALVGGMTKKGDPRRSVLRKGYLIDPTRTHDIVFDYEAIQKKKQQDFEVEAGDLVVILPRPKHPTVWQQLLPLALHLIPLPF